MPRNPFVIHAAAALPQASPRERKGPSQREKVAKAKAALGAFDARKAVLALPEGLVPGAARVVVPFPPTPLNPNSRALHPARKSTVASAYRDLCWALALEALGTGFARQLPREGAVRVHLDFFPPTGAVRDDDNLEAAFKAGRDGIARAMGIDDSRWATSKRLRAEVRGCVVVTVQPDEAAIFGRGAGK